MGGTGMAGHMGLCIGFGLGCDWFWVVNWVDLDACEVCLMAFPPIMQEYHADLALYSAAGILALFKWRKLPRWPATWGVSACCFRLAGFWMSVGEAVQYFGERRAENRAKAMEVENG